MSDHRPLGSRSRLATLHVVAVSLATLAFSGSGTRPAEEVPSEAADDTGTGSPHDVADATGAPDGHTPVDAAVDIPLDDAAADPEDDVPCEGNQCGCFVEGNVEWAQPIWTSFWDAAEPPVRPPRRARIAPDGDGVLVSSAFSRFAWFEPLDPDGQTSETISLQSFLVGYGPDGACRGPGDIGSFSFSDEIRAIVLNGPNTTLMTSDVVAYGCPDPQRRECHGSVSLGIIQAAPSEIGASTKASARSPATRFWSTGTPLGSRGQSRQRTTAGSMGSETALQGSCPPWSEAPTCTSRNTSQAPSLGSPSSELSATNLHRKLCSGAAATRCFFGAHSAVSSSNPEQETSLRRPTPRT